MLKAWGELRKCAHRTCVCEKTSKTCVRAGIFNLIAHHTRATALDNLDLLCTANANINFGYICMQKAMVNENMQYVKGYYAQCETSFSVLERPFQF